MENTAEDRPVEAVSELSDDAKNVIENMGVRTLGELAGKTTHDLMRMRGCSRAMVQEIQGVLHANGLKLRE